MLLEKSAVGAMHWTLADILKNTVPFQIRLIQPLLSILRYLLNKTLWDGKDSSYGPKKNSWEINMNNLTESFNHHSAGMKRKRLVPSVCHTMHLTDSSHQYPKKIKSCSTAPNIDRQHSCTTGACCHHSSNGNSKSAHVCLWLCQFSDTRCLQ